MARLPHPYGPANDPLQREKPLSGNAVASAFMEWYFNRKPDLLPDEVKNHGSYYFEFQTLADTAWLIVHETASPGRNGRKTRITVPWHIVPVERCDWWHDLVNHGATLREAYLLANHNSKKAERNYTLAMSMPMEKFRTEYGAVYLSTKGA